MSKKNSSVILKNGFKNFEDLSKVYLNFKHNFKKLKYKIELSTDLSKEEIEKVILSDENFIKKLDGNKPKRVIIVPGKIINFVV